MLNLKCRDYNSCRFFFLSQITTKMSQELSLTVELHLGKNRVIIEVNGRSFRFPAFMKHFSVITWMLRQLFLFFSFLLYFLCFHLILFPFLSVQMITVILTFLLLFPCLLFPSFCPYSLVLSPCVLVLSVVVPEQQDKNNNNNNKGSKKEKKKR